MVHGKEAKNSDPAVSAGHVAEVAHPHQRAFLAAFRETGNVRLACMAAKVGRSSHYRWLEEDPQYRTAFDVAKDDTVDLLEAEAYRRAVEGVEKPTGWYKGVAGGQVREYSDLLLMFLLKGLRPEKYRDRIEVGGALAKIDFTKLTPAQLDRIAKGEHYLAVLANPGERPALPAGQGIEQAELVPEPLGSVGAGP